MTDFGLSKRRLGRAGAYVTPLGLGGAWLGRTADGLLDESMGIATVLRALELGVNLIDTSAAYLRRESERFIGLALEEWYRHGGRREDLVLTTKTGTHVRPPDYSAEATRESVARSLELLKTDYLDVVLVHDPHDLSPVLAPGGALEALQTFKAQGVVHAIGLGVRAHALHRRLIEAGLIDVSLTHRDYQLLNQSAVEGVLEVAAAHDVGVLNGSPTLNGLLGGGDPLEFVRERETRGWRPQFSNEEVQRARALWEFGQAHGISLLALNLQFCRRESRIAATLVGASQPEQIEADVAAMLAPIPGKVWTALRSDFGI
jgi:aryl-alcohol dehydrogenase-like predicted oxidoreductase